MLLLDENQIISHETDAFEDNVRLKESLSNSSNGGVNVLMLATVLGSIAVLCFAAFSIALFVVKKKKTIS